MSWRKAPPHGQFRFISASLIQTFMLNFFRIALALALTCLSMTVLGQVCGAPGATGSATITAANTVVNTYYPGTAAGAAALGTSIGYTSASSRGIGGAIVAGDLILIIQMQDGTGATTANTAAYAFPAAAAGRHEFARVLSVGTNLLNLTSALTNSYTQNTAVANNQTYQVVRVPQYSTLTINAAASIVPEAWDGTTGGIVVFDVSGAFTNNGNVNASYAGFRGNSGVTLGGQTGAAALTVATLDYVRPDTYLAHGGKGEGIGGTPDAVMRVFSAAGVLQTSGTTSANGTATNATTAATSIAGLSTTYRIITGRSYSGGSRAAGAPANAGGGGDDSAPASNSENSGGGGGGNAGAGGIGGNTWNTNIALGGKAGLASAPSLTGRLIMGGGGGSGSTNNNYRDDSSGGAGGGLIFIKAGSVGGAGALLANGQAGRAIPVRGTNCPANSTTNCDGAGGGGAGGAVVVLASSGTIASAQVRGGQGGNINGTDHGPGGGGGGGFIVRSSVLALTANVVNGGAAGLMNLGGTATAYGAGAGVAGTSAVVTNSGLPATAGGLPANCLPALNVTKTTLTPASVDSISPPATTTYSIVVVNTLGRGDARAISLYEPTLPGGTVTVVNPPAPTFSFSVSPSACALSSRTSVVNPANGATSTWTAGIFSLPGGCTLTYTFTVNIPTTVPNGTYNNSAVAWFVDPSDSSGNRTVTTALPPAATGLSANTAFTTGGAVGGSNYDGASVSNTAEDILIQRKALLSVTKTNVVTSLTAGQTTSYTVTFANSGPASADGATIRDIPSAGLSCTVSNCIPAGTGVCPAVADRPNILTGAGLVLSSFASGATLTFTLSCQVTATGQP